MSYDPGFVRRFIKQLKKEKTLVVSAHYPRRRGEFSVHSYMMRPEKWNKNFVISVHGTGNDSLFPQIHLFKALLDAGFGVFTFDVDGHGRHSNTLLESKEIALCLADAYSYLASKEPHINGLHILGHSLGASIALAAISQRLIAVNSAVLVSMPTSLRIRKRTILFEAASVFKLSILRHTKTYGTYGFLPAVGNFKRGHYPIRVAQAWSAVAPFRYVELIKQILNDLNLEEVELPEDQPILFIFGEKDRIAAPNARLLDPQKLKLSKLLMLKNETHFTTPFSREMVEEMLSWFKRNTK